MKNTKVVCLLAVLAVGALLLAAANAGAVSEDARRHMARGQAAVEMAKSPAEYDSAISEFQAAARIEPNWPDPYYNLGLAQEKSGKLREAAASYKKYLQLAPNAPDAAKIQEQIYKLEYKAEQILTVPEIIDVLVSFRGWQKEGECWDYFGRTLAFERKGHDKVTVVEIQQFPSPRYQVLNVTGPVLKYTSVRDAAADEATRVSLHKEIAIDWTAWVAHEVTVVSKRLVKVNQKVLRAGVGNGAISDGQSFSCTFRVK